jgi:hypothetical protein
VRGATAGHAQTCAWTNNGAISCWGNDEQEGKHLENTPPLSGVVSASTSYHACAIVEAGRVACWTAIGGPSDPVKRLEGIDEVAAAPAMTCARRGREPVWCWGGDFGVDPPGPEGPAAWKDLSDVAALSFGLDGPTCALRADHTVACFTKPALEPVAGLDDAVAVAVGGSHLCVRRSDCSAWCRGDNTYGQLGIGSMGASASLQRVADLAGVVELAAGTDHTCARTQDGALWCWGRRSHGQLGEGEEMSGGQFKPVPVDMSSMCP